MAERTNPHAEIVVGAQDKATPVFDSIRRSVENMANAVAGASTKAGDAVGQIGEKSERSSRATTTALSALARAQSEVMRSLVEASGYAQKSADGIEYLARLRNADVAAIQAQVHALRDFESVLSSVQAAQREASAAALFEQQHQAAKRLVQDAAYVRWWTDALEQKERAERVAASQNDFIASLKRQSDAIGKTRADLLELQAAQLGVTDKAAPFIAKLREQEKQFNAYGLSAKQTAAALRQVPAQITDIVVSLQGGQAPLTVLLQQGGQLRDLFGGIAPAAKALGSTVLGLINPFTVAAAAVGGLAFAYRQGASEQEAFQRALILSGNAVGASADRLGAMAASIGSAAFGITRSKAAATLAEIASKADIGAASLERYTKAALEFERAGGGAAQEVTKAFSEIARDPVNAIVKLNEAMRFLTASTYAQIKSLDEQGKTLEAAKLAADAYASAIENRTPKLEENLGYLEKAWKGIEGTAAKAWDAMLGIGRAASLDEQIAALQTQVDAGRANPIVGSGYAAARGRAVQAQNEAALSALKEQKRLLESAAMAERARAQQEKARIEWIKAGEKYLSDQVKMEREIAKVREDGIRAGASQEEIEMRIAKIREAYTKKPSTGGRTGKSDAQRELEAMEATLAKLSGVNADYVKQLGMIQKARESGRITEEQSIELLNELISKQPMAIEMMRQQADAEKEIQRARELLVQAQERSAANVEQQVQKLRDEEEALAISAAMNISLAEALEIVAMARLEEAKAKEVAKGRDADQEVIAAIEREIKARKELAELMGKREQRENMKKAAEDAAKAWEKTADEISQALTDALMRGFEAGKGFGENFADSLENMLKTQVARALQQAIAQGLSSLFGFGGNGGGGALGMANNASSLVQMFSGGGSNFGAVRGWATGGMSTANMLGSIYANTVTAGMTTGSIAASGAGIDALLATNAAYGTAATGAGAASGMAGAFSALSAIPAWGWVAIAAMALWEPLFGRKLKGYGYYVDIAGGAVDVGGYEYHKGGLFRSNKTIEFDVDPRDAEELRRQVEAVRDSSAAMARAMGYSDEAIESFTGSLKINFKGAETAAEQSERYNEALMDLQRQMINAATGANYTKEQFADFMAGIREDIAAAGISSQGIADILVDGMMGRLSQKEVGDALADMIVGGIYDSIASNYANMIAEAFMGQIITPIFTAMMSGVPLSQAVSQAAIDNVVATAQNAMAALNQILNSAEIQAAMVGIETAIKGVVGATSRVKIPSFGSARNSAAQKAQQQAQERYNLETRLLQLLGKTDILRQRELASINAANRALQQHIWAVEDATDGVNNAMAALERAVGAERDRLQEQLDAAMESERALNDVFGVLRRNIRDLRGEVESTSQIDAAAGRDLIQQAIAGTKFDADELADAIDAVRHSIENGNYATRFDQKRAQLKLAAELSLLSDVTESELSAAEQQIALLEDQLNGLDVQLDLAQQQIDALFGVDTSVKDVAAAVAALGDAMGEYSAAIAAAAAQSFSTGAAPSGSSSGGGSYLVSGGSSAKQWTAQGYWDKNPDLQREFIEKNLAASPDFNKDPNLSARDEYLWWHWITYGQKEGRKYARGGYYPGGLALVGEEGPELINFAQPGQVYTADQTRNILVGSNAEVVRLLRELIDNSRSQSVAMVRPLVSMDKLFSRWELDGLPQERSEA